jgi:hypothetical protein
LQLGVEGAQNNGETNLIASVSVDGTVSNFLKKPLLSSDFTHHRRKYVTSTEACDFEVFLLFLFF